MERAFCKSSSSGPRHLPQALKHLHTTRTWFIWPFYSPRWQKPFISPAPSCQVCFQQARSGWLARFLLHVVATGRIAGSHLGPSGALAFCEPPQESSTKQSVATRGQGGIFQGHLEVQTGGDPSASSRSRVSRSLLGNSRPSFLSYTNSFFYRLMRGT